MVPKLNLGGDFIFSPHRSTQLRHTPLFLRRIPLRPHRFIKIYCNVGAEEERRWWRTNVVWRGDNYNENMLMMMAMRARASQYSVSYKEWREIFISKNLFLSGMKFPVKIQYVFRYGSIFKSAQNVGISIPD